VAPFFRRRLEQVSYLPYLRYATTEMTTKMGFNISKEDDGLSPWKGS